MAEGTLPRPRSHSGQASGGPGGTALPSSTGQSKLNSYLRAVPVLLLGLAVSLAYWAVGDAHEAARADFSQQQLALAHQVAARAEASLQDLHLELSSLVMAVEEGPDVTASLPSLFRGTLRRGGTALVEVRYASVLTGRTTFLSQRGRVAEEAYDANDRALLQMPELARGVDNRAYLLSVPSGLDDRPLLALAQPIEIDGATDGLLYLLIDGRQLAANASSGARSGRTGYAWITDATGVLLAHPVRELVGQNLFQENEGHRLVAFAPGDEALRQIFLSGQEGSGTYLSGVQDTDDDRPREKLVAFAPIQAAGEGANRNWMAAVVAPAAEVDAGGNALLLKLLAGLAVAIAAVALAFVLYTTGQQRRAQELQRAAEAARLRLARAQERLRLVADTSDDLIFTMAEDGRVVQANRAALRLLTANLPARHGVRNPDEALGNSIQDLLPGETGEFLHREAAEALRQRRATTREHALTVGREERWFSTRLRPLPEVDEGPGAVLAVSRDLTQKRQIEEQLCNTEKLAALGTLAAGVAHEINNPLTSIMGYADLLLDKFPPGSQERQDLQTIERCGQHCRLIVENLLDYARIGTNLGEATNVNDDFDTVLGLVGAMLLANKIVVERHLDPKLPSIPANSQEIQQVLLNLINNAIHAMKKGGGVLTISTAVRGNRLMASVADTGCGIPAEVQDKIFAPFFTTKGGGEGTGLGLSVSLGLVQKLGGTITFTSSTGNRQKGEPSGSVFTVILPLPPEEVMQS